MGKPRPAYKNIHPFASAIAGGRTIDPERVAVAKKTKVKSAREKRLE